MGVIDGAARLKAFPSKREGDGRRRGLHRGGKGRGPRGFQASLGNTEHHASDLLFPYLCPPQNRVGKRGDRSLGENGKLKNKTDKTKPSRTDMNNLKPAVLQRLDFVKITGGLPWSCSPEQWAPLGFHSACPGLLLHGP